MAYSCGGDSQDFFDSGLAAQGFNQTIQLHGQHAFLDGCLLDGFAGAVADDHFLDAVELVSTS